MIPIWIFLIYKIPYWKNMASDKEESESEMSEEAESSLSTKAVDSSQPSKAEQMMRVSLIS